MQPHTWRVAALLFASGFCALVYQIGWLRELRLIFGASTAASAAVLAIFIGGLGAGGLLLGRRADHHRRPIRLYAQLEGIVAVLAAASPLLLWLVRELYIVAGGTPRLGLAAGTIARLVLTALVLGVPTIAMGGTFPAAARGVTQDADTRRRDVAALYALNTLGAVVGCLAATFLLLEVFGTRRTLWLAAGINLLVAIAAREVDRTAADGDRAAVLSPHDRAMDPSVPVPFVLMASGVVGFVFFLMELVWYRMLGPLLGGSVFTFGLILAVALTGIGVGGLMYALVSQGRPAKLTGFAVSCLIEAIAIAAAYALGDRLAVLTLVLRPLMQVGFAAQVAGWLLVTAIVVLPAAIVAGYQFPMLIALLGRGREHLGRQIGLAYAANTLGAIGGALAGGFGVLPWLSAPGAWRFVSMALVSLGLAAAFRSWIRRDRRAIALPLGLAAASVAFVAATGPTAVWRHSGIGAGRARAATMAANDLREWMRAHQRAIVWDEDGTESSVALAIEANGYAFLINGKSDGSARGDAGTQVMLGLIGGLLNPEARRSLVIGLGTGSTAGWLGAIPSMERVDVVEIEPLIVEVARVCREVNHDVLANPKVHVTIGDAREILLTTRDRYDLIASEPSNPFRAGIASLFTREYYAAASDLLTDEGLFLQWVQMYEIDARTLRTIYATIASVFPHVESWQAGAGDLVLVGAKQPLVYRFEALAARAQEEPFRSALSATWRAVDATGLLAHFVANARFTPLVANTADVNTDDRNIVEFGFARSVGSGESLLADVRRLARAAGHARPTSADTATVDWEAVETAWLGYQMSERHFTGITFEGFGQEQARRAALVAYYRDSNLQAAEAAWRRQTRPPAGPIELAMVIDFAAEAGSEAAVDLIEELSAFQPGEASTLRATLRFRQARFDEAASALEAALVDFRTNPWAQYQFQERAIALASAVAAHSPALATRMFEALRRPLAVLALQDRRQTAVALLAARVDVQRFCRDAVRTLEPQVPWNRAFLTLRRDCYQAVADARAELASRELDEFLAHEAVPLAALVTAQADTQAPKP